MSCFALVQYCKDDDNKESQIKPDEIYLRNYPSLIKSEHIKLLL